MGAPLLAVRCTIDVITTKFFPLMFQPMRMRVLVGVLCFTTKRFKMADKKSREYFPMP